MSSGTGRGRLGPAPKPAQNVVEGNADYLIGAVGQIRHMKNNVHLSKLRQLDLAAPAQPGRPSYISAASGLVKTNRHFFVVADDELQLAVFDCVGDAPGALLRLFDGELPVELRDRKARKPDFEALVALQPFADYREGALLALGSGSRKGRRRAALLPLTDSSVEGPAVRRLDASKLFEALASEVDDANVEGAIVVRDHLVLMHRGNARHPDCALISCRLEPLLRSIRDDDKLGKVHIDSVRHYELGKIDGAPLTFTDGCLLDDGSILFAAVAEQTDDSFSDGPCRGSALGEIGPDGNLRRIEYLEDGWKVEGIAAEPHGNLHRLWLVTDADDVRVPASLLVGEWPG